VLVNNPIPAPISLGPNQEAHVYGQGTSQVVFLSNIATSNYTVTYAGTQYVLSAWSTQILSNGQIYFDTSASGTPSTLTYTPKVNILKLGSNLGWWPEPAGVWGKGLPSTAPLEQIGVTQDNSDYLWYTQNVTIPAGGATVKLTNTNDMAYIFVDGAYIGGGVGGTISANIPSSISGPHTLQILSLTVGLVNYELHMEAYDRGILGNVTLGSQVITTGNWVLMPGLKGEALQLYTAKGSSSVSWTPGWSGGVNKPLTWFSGVFSVNGDPTSFGWVLDMIGMGKGQVWVNGNHLGRYWLITASGSCTPCNYAGPYDPSKCRTGCGQPSQRYYHVPRDWLTAQNNTIVFFEETGGDPSNVQLTLATSS